MAFIPSSGSVAAWIQSSNGSVITVIPTLQGASISGTVNVGNAPSIYGNISGSVVSYMGGPWSVSIIGSLTPPANQSVSGAVSVSNFPANQSVSGNVGITGTPAVSVQGTVFVSGSVVTVGSSGPANQSVSGTVGASVIGTVPVTFASSIYGNISGSVAATVTNTVTVVSSLVGGIFPISGSVSAVITNTNLNVSGSVVAFLGNSTNASVITVGTAVANQSVSGTVIVTGLQGASVSGTVGASVIGTVPVTQSTTPWTISSVYGNVSGSIAGTYVSSTVAVAVTGLAMMFKPNISTSIMTEISPTYPLPITGAVAASISGTVVTTLSGNPSISGTVLVNNGSVVAFQGTSPWLETFSNSSIIAIASGSIVSLSSGSVITVLQSSSILSVPVGSVITVIQSSSIIAVPTGNQSISGVVGASIIGYPNINIGGSIAGTYIEPTVVTSTTGIALVFKSNVSTSVMTAVSVANPLPVSVQGTISVGNTVTINSPSVYGNISGSVAAFLQGNASVITIVQSSVATVIIGGSISATFTPPANQSVSGTVGASIIGNIPVVIQSSVATVIIGGSISATFTPPANQSVSGTVGSSIIGLPPFNISDGTNTANVLSSVGGSNSSVMQGALITSGGYLEVPFSASVVTAIAATDVSNYRWVSVQIKANGTSATETFQTSNDGVTWVSTALLSSAAVGLTVPAVSTAAAGLFYGPLTGRYFRINVTGITAASTVGVAEFFTSPGALVGTPNGEVFAADNVDGVSSVVTANKNINLSRNTVWDGASWDRMRGSTTGVYTEIRDAAGNARGVNVNASNQLSVSIDGSTGNTSVSGTVGASIIGQLPSGTAMIGSVTAYQGAIPWTIGSVYGNISGSVFAVVSELQGHSVSGTVVITQLAGSILATSATVSAAANQSVSGVVMAQGLNAPSASITGNPVYVGGLDQNGSVQGAKIVTVVSVAGGLAWLGITSVSGIAGASIIGQLPAGNAIIGAVAASISGTVITTFTNSSIIALQSGSVVSINQGSIATVQIGQAGTVITSVAGTYATNAASIISGLGVLTLGVRNDSLGSVLATADGFYGPHTVGAWGDQIVSFAPSPKWVSGIASCFTGVEQPLITSVLGARVNVTSLQMANASANNVYMTFYGAGIGSVTGSIIGYSVVPANGGSNITYPVPLQTAINAGFSASVSGVASVFLSAQGFLSKV